MILEGSRYQTAQLVRVVDAAGKYHPTIFRSVATQTTQAYTTYVWQDFDRLDILAAKYLGDPELYWMILDLNPEIMDPLSITPGTVLRIPQEVSSP